MHLIQDKGIIQTAHQLVAFPDLNLVMLSRNVLGPISWLDKTLWQSSASSHYQNNAVQYSDQHPIDGVYWQTESQNVHGKWHPAVTQSQPLTTHWIQIDFGAQRAIYRVILFGRY